MNEEIKTKEVKVNPEMEPAVISKGQLAGILAELSSLKNRGVPKKAERVKEHIATLRFHENKPVIWFGNVDEKRDSVTGKSVAYMDIKLQGEEGLINVPYLQFLNTSNFVKVQILSQKAEKVIQSEGTFMTENPDQANRGGKSSNFQSQEMEAEIVSYKYQAELEVLEGPHVGLKLTVPSECLNQ